MRWSHVFLISCAAILLNFAQPAQAAWRGYAVADVNMRSGPSVRYRVKVVVPRGSRLRVRNCRRSWCNVRFRRLRGWVSRRYISQSARRIYRRPRYRYRPPVYIYPPFFDEPYYDWPPIIYPPRIRRPGIYWRPGYRGPRGYAGPRYRGPRSGVPRGAGRPPGRVGGGVVGPREFITPGFDVDTNRK